MQRFIMTAAGVGLLTVGTAGVAAAQDTGGGSTSSSTPASAKQAPTPNGKGRHRRAGAVLRVTAKTLGVTPRDLVVQLCGGQTIAQIASQHGKSTPDVIHALVTAADHRIDQAVKAGRLDATKAAQRKSHVEPRVTARVNDFKPSAARSPTL